MPSFAWRTNGLFRRPAVLVTYADFTGTIANDLCPLRSGLLRTVALQDLNCSKTHHLASGASRSPATEVGRPMSSSHYFLSSSQFSQHTCAARCDSLAVSFLSDQKEPWAATLAQCECQFCFGSGQFRLKRSHPFKQPCFGRDVISLPVGIDLGIVESSPLV